MGLDITAYSNAKLTPEHEYSDNCYDQGHRLVLAYAGFERSYRGLAHPAEPHVTPGSDQKWVGGRCYDVSESEEHDFRAGSYSGYSHWRQELATLVGVDPAQYWNDDGDVDLPFYELINFADNEGDIGPEAAADLLQDFREYHDLAAASMDEYFMERYQDWTRACELAVQNGFIDFH